MQLLHWWSPLRSLRSAAVEMRHERSSWLTLLRRGGRTLSNFGDEASPLLLSEIVGRKFDWAPMARADVVGVGSLLESYVRDGSRARIFGSGSRSGGNLDIPHDAIIAVRGPLTALTVGAAHVAQGDPGLVISELVNRSPRERGGTVLVPHFRAFGTRAGRLEISRLNRLGFEIILPTSSPMEVADRIARADKVVTSSLHGLIFAHGLNRPAHLVRFDGVSAEPQYKYDDHCALFGFGAEMASSRSLSDGTRLPGPMLGEMERTAYLVSSALPKVLESLYAAGADLK